MVQTEVDYLCPERRLPETCHDHSLADYVVVKVSLCMYIGVWQC